MTALVRDTESRASVPVFTASTSVNHAGKWVRLAMPVIAAVLDARVEVQSFGDTPGSSILADGIDLGIDSGSEENGSGLLMRHSITDTLLARPLFFIGPIVRMSSYL